jgi:hypothetical protein
MLSSADERLRVDDVSSTAGGVVRVVHGLIASGVAA